MFPFPNDPIAGKEIVSPCHRSPRIPLLCPAPLLRARGIGWGRFRPRDPGDGTTSVEERFPDPEMFPKS